ncbi:DUF928 domain-containing protein [Scytonema hofmannii]|nr:DUF928 domain-containing protein [Scytonema hofmannii]
MPNQRNSVLKFCLLGSALLMLLFFTPMWDRLEAAQVVTFRPPRLPAPRHSTGGASRSGNNCLMAEKVGSTASVTALLPSSGIGLTVKERPAILVYIPPTTAKKALFGVQDEQAINHYQTTINLPEKPGVMAIKLPDSVPGIKTGKNYQWSLAMICSSELEPDSPLVSGWIQRIEYPVGLKNQSRSSPSLELASHLAKHGVWYDTIFELAKLRQAEPLNPIIKASWQQLLNAVGLNAIANAPLAKRSTYVTYWD